MVKQRRIIDALGKTYPEVSLGYLPKRAPKANRKDLKRDSSFFASDRHTYFVTEFARFYNAHVVFSHSLISTDKEQLQNCVKIKF